MTDRIKRYTSYDCGSGSLGGMRFCRIGEKFFSKRLKSPRTNAESLTTAAYVLFTIKLRAGSKLSAICNEAPRADEQHKRAPTCVVCKSVGYCDS
eukprot:6203480-Pleurochrysis_carterae.AAC.2